MLSRQPGIQLLNVRALRAQFPLETFALLHVLGVAGGGVKVQRGAGLLGLFELRLQFLNRGRARRERIA